MFDPGHKCDHGTNKHTEYQSQLRILLFTDTITGSTGIFLSPETSTDTIMAFIIIIIITTTTTTTLFESQIILAEHACCTNWGDCKSNKSNQIRSNQ